MKHKITLLLAATLTSAALLWSGCDSREAAVHNGKDGKGISEYTTVINDDGSRTVSLFFTDGDRYDVVIPAPERGSDGRDGAGWLSGKGQPDRSSGNDGDLYLDGETCDVYRKSDGGWTLFCNIGATYRTEQITLTFDTGCDGITVPPLTVEKGQITELPEPARENYRFTGWYRGTGVNAGLFTNTTPATEDMTLYARWEKLPDANNPVEQEVYWNAPTGVDCTEYTRKTFTATINAAAHVRIFIGSTELDGSGEDEGYRGFAYEISADGASTTVRFTVDAKADGYALRLVAVVGDKSYEHTVAITVRSI